MVTLAHTGLLAGIGITINSVFFRLVWLRWVPLVQISFMPFTREPHLFYKKCFDLSRNGLVDVDSTWRIGRQKFLWKFWAFGFLGFP